jgi:hypothetical protein
MDRFNFWIVCGDASTGGVIHFGYGQFVIGQPYLDETDRNYCMWLPGSKCPPRGRFCGK